MIDSSRINSEEQLTPPTPAPPLPIPALFLPLHLHANSVLTEYAPAAFGNELRGQGPLAKGPIITCQINVKKTGGPGTLAVVGGASG